MDQVSDVNDEEAEYQKIYREINEASLWFTVYVMKEAKY